MTEPTETPDDDQPDPETDPAPAGPDDDTIEEEPEETTDEGEYVGDSPERSAALRGGVKADNEDVEEPPSPSPAQSMMLS